MIKTHVSEGGETMGRCVPCNANVRECPKGEGAHVQFAGINEMNAYNTMTHELSDIDISNEAVRMFIGEVEPSDRAQVKFITETARRLRNDRVSIYYGGESMQKKTLEQDMAEGRAAQSALWDTTTGLSSEQPVGITNLRQGPVTTSGGWIHKMDIYDKAPGGGLEDKPTKALFCNGSTLVSVENGRQLMPGTFEGVHPRTGSLVTISTRRHPGSSVATVEGAGEQGLDLHDNTRGQALDDLIDAMEHDSGGDQYDFKVKIQPNGKAFVESKLFRGGDNEAMLDFDEFRETYPSAAKHLDTLIAGDAGYRQ